MSSSRLSVCERRSDSVGACGPCRPTRSRRVERRAAEPPPKRSAAVSAEDQPQRPRNRAGARRNQGRPVRTTCCGWCSAHTAALREISSRSATGPRSQRVKSEWSVGILGRLSPCVRAAGGDRPRAEILATREDFAESSYRAAQPQPQEFGTPFPHRWFPLVSARPSRPGGTPEEISRGQVRASGRRPRKSCRVTPCPSGASKKWLAWRADRWRTDLPEATSGGVMLPRVRRQKLLRCPAGAWPVRRGNRGPRPRARACPRLISYGVPPGHRAKRWRQFFGGRLAARAAAKASRAARFRRAGGPRPQRPRTRQGAGNSQRPGSNDAAATGDRSRSAFGCGFAALYYLSAKSSRATRIFPGARLCARRTSRSGLAAGDASDFNGRVRAFGAAAAGPRRTQPRTVGSGFAALCSSRLWGPLGSFPCIDTAYGRTCFTSLWTEAAMRSSMSPVQRKAGRPYS